MSYSFDAKIKKLIVVLGVMVMIFTSISSVSAVYAYLKASKVTILGTTYQVKSRANYDYDTNKWTFNGESISYYSGLGTAGCGFNSKSTTTSTESNGTVMVAKRTFVCYGKNSTSTTKTGTTIITWKFNRSEKTYVS